MAYTTATLVSKGPVEEDGRIRIIVEFVGNAGEPTLRRARYVSNETIQDLRRWARDEADALLGRKNIADLLTVGASLSLTPPPGPSPAEVTFRAWLEKANRASRIRALGLTNATAVANLATLDAEVNAGYLAAYVNFI